MKKSLKISLTLFTLFAILVNSQEIINVDYGENYLNFKEMGFRAFSKNQYSYKSPKSRVIRAGFGHDKITYLQTPFLRALQKRDKDVSTEYQNELLTMKEEFSKSMQKGYWKEFEQGTKKAYDYLLLNLEKFEILSEHFKSLFNLELASQEANQEIKKNNKSLDDNYSKIINECRENEYNKNKNLYSLKKTSKEQIDKVEDFFKKEETVLANEIKGKINKLGPSNYDINKRKIINDYKPTLISFSVWKKDSLTNLNSYWGDKIKEEVSATEKILKGKISIIEDKKLRKKDSIRKVIKGKFNLTEKEDLIFIKYDSLISIINEKIKKK